MPSVPPSVIVNRTPGPIAIDGRNYHPHRGRLPWVTPTGEVKGLAPPEAGVLQIVSLDVAEAAAMADPDRADLLVPRPFGGVCRPLRASPALRALRPYLAAADVERAIVAIPRPTRLPGWTAAGWAAVAVDYADKVAEAMERTPVQDLPAGRAGTRAGWARSCAFILDQLRRAGAPDAYLDMVSGMATDPLCGKPADLARRMAEATAPAASAKVGDRVSGDRLPPGAVGKGNDGLYLVRWPEPVNGADAVWVDDEDAGNWPRFAVRGATGEAVTIVAVGLTAEQCSAWRPTPPAPPAPPPGYHEGAIERPTRERDAARESLAATSAALRIARAEADEALRRADAAAPEVERLRGIVVELAARLVAAP